MDLKNYLNKRNMTKYHLSKISGIPKEVIMDICSGKVKIEDCSEDIIRNLADALGCTVEYLRRCE